MERLGEFGFGVCVCVCLVLATQRSCGDAVVTSGITIPVDGLSQCENREKERERESELCRESERGNNRENED